MNGGRGFCVPGSFDPLDVSGLREELAKGALVDGVALVVRVHYPDGSLGLWRTSAGLDWMTREALMRCANEDPFWDVAGDGIVSEKIDEEGVD